MAQFGLQVSILGSIQWLEFYWTVWHERHYSGCCRARPDYRRCPLDIQYLVIDVL
jgi:hypothetical protein